MLFVILSLCIASAAAVLNNPVDLQQLAARVSADAGVVAVPTQTKSNVCSLCNIVTSLVEAHVVNNSTQTQIKETLGEACENTPFPDICNAFVSAQLPGIVAWLKTDQSTDYICQKLSACTAEEADAPLAFGKVQGGGLCGVCQLVVGFVEHYIEQNHTEKEIKHDLDLVCALFGGLKTQCDSLVATYLKTIIHYVDQKYPAAQVCKLIGLCSSVSTDDLSLRAPIVGKKHKGCGICKTIVGYVELYLSKGATEAAIAKKLKKLCKLTIILKKICVNLIDKDMDKIIQAIKKKEPPAKICAQLHLCGSSVDQLEAGHSELVELVQPVKTQLVDLVKPTKDQLKLVDLVKPVLENQPQGGGFCGVCQLVVGFVEHYVAQNKSQTEIKHDLDIVCALTGGFKKECDNLVAKYLPTIIHYLTSKYTPAHICQLVGACTSVGIIKPEAPQAGFCGICELVVGFVDHYLAENHTAKQIESKLDVVCALTGSYKKECDKLVATYLPSIIHYVEQHYPASKVCALVGACTSTTNDVVVKTPVIELPVSQKTSKK